MEFMQKTLDQFIIDWLGKKCDYDGFYGGQCVDLYRQYVKEVLGYPQSPGVGGATEIWDSASPEYYDFIKNSPTAVPQRGDIPIWNRKAGGGFGHVSIFLHGDVNKFTSLDQNWPTLDEVTETEHDYKNIIGWLRPKTDVNGKVTELTSLLDKEKRLHEVTRNELRGLVDNDKIELETEKKRLKTIADNMGIMHLNSEVDDERPKLWAKVVTESATFGKYKNGYDEFKLKYEKEVEARTKDLATHQIELQKLKDELKLEQDKNNKKVDNIAKKIEVALEQNVEKKEAVEQDKLDKIKQDQLVQERKNWLVKFINRIQNLFKRG